MILQKKKAFSLLKCKQERQLTIFLNMINNIHYSGHEYNINFLFLILKQPLVKRLHK